MFMGSYDILAADARKMKIIAEAEGVVVHYLEYTAMVHMWMFMNFREARLAQQDVLNCLR
jgi:acetyl esterase/lipase